MVDDELVEKKKLDILYETGETTCATFRLHNEDHTLANAIRYALMKDPAIEFAGYSIPHPLENAVNIRVQTTGIPAVEGFTKSLDTLDSISQTILSKFRDAIADYTASNQMDDDPMDI